MRSVLPLVFLGVLVGACLVGATGTLPAFRVERWVNSMPLTAEALRGKVVLLDIWEYTCINWIRTSPYVKAWHRDYAARGLVVVGLHAPEFEFVKRADNIDRGIRDHGLTYPIALDNDFATWRALGNDAWPAKYLYDSQGKLVKRWVGEGHYDEIEEELRRQLIAAHPATQLPSITTEVMAFARAGQPSYAGITSETYVGSDRREPDTITLEGDWLSGRQNRILHLRARIVAVAASPEARMSTPVWNTTSHAGTSQPRRGGRRPRVSDVGLETVDRDITGIWKLTRRQIPGAVDASNILGQPREANHAAMARVVFTDPQAAASA